LSKARKPIISSKQAPKPPARTAASAGESLPAGVKVGLALLAVWILALLIFPEIILNGYNFVMGGDNLAAAPIARMGEKFAEQGQVPDWVPYILGGMPLVGSLTYANHYYPGFFLGDLLGFIFFGSSYAWLFLHYLLAGLGVFLVLRELKVHWALAALCGLLFAYNPPMVVYADVGHGSKLMTMAYLPWVLLFTKRLFDRPTLDRAALLALTFGLQLLALHVQIAYYGAMIMGLYAVYSLIAGGKAELGRNLRATGLLAAAGLLGFFVSSPLYLQVQEYSQYSIRGGGATGGASWDYATQWSFHPLETLTYIFPSFFGFGGREYWGFMPFTDMPYYWGGVALLFAPWALALTRNRVTIFLLVLALLAWAASWGKFLPVLYWPLFEFLPYFNKFRVPSLLQILVLLPMVILAGKGLQAVWEAAAGREDRAQRLGQKFLLAGGVIAGVCLLLLILSPMLKSVFTGWISGAREHLQGPAADASFALFTGDLLRLILLTAVLYGSAWAVLKLRWPRTLLIAAVALAAGAELYHFDRRLIHPTPPEQLENYLQANDVVRFLQGQSEPFRIFPFTDLNPQTAVHNPNWYMPHQIESIIGYTGAKMRLYQEMVDSIGYGNPNFLRLMNTRYLVSSRPLAQEGFEEVFAGRQEHVYRFAEAFPRAFLVNRAVQVGSPQEALRLYRGEFDFATTAALEAPLSAPLEENATGQVRWIEKRPDYLALEVETTGRQLLTLSEVYYPSGWTATLNGQEVPILKTNYFLRGVEIPAGTHRLEMRFVPESKGLGNTLKWIALVLIAGGLVWGLVISRRLGKSPSGSPASTPE